MERSGRFWWEWLGAFFFCAALCGFFQFLTPFVTETDGYYHIKMAELMRHQGLFRHGFPWAYSSLWRDGFSDGSLLFHLLLVPFTFGDLAFGAKLATVLLAAFMFSSFFAILTLNRARGRFYWSWLLLVGGVLFWRRMLVPRPQILSVSLLLWSLHFLLNDKRRAFAALSFLYPLSYSAAFLPQVFAVARWAYLKITEGRSEHRIVLAGLGTYALATIVHPYFPKNLVFFYVSNIYVMYLAQTQKVGLDLGVELQPLDTRQLLGAHLPLVAHFTGLWFAFLHRRTPLSERTRVLFPIVVIVLALTCASARFVEYSVPVTTLFCALLYTDLSEGWDWARFRRSCGALYEPVLVFWLAAMVIVTGATGARVIRALASTPPPRFKELSATLAKAAPAREIVYTCDWDETPELFFFDDQRRYLVMLDPTFMYWWSPATWRSWTDVAYARLTPDQTVRTLTDVFHARYGLCGRRFSDLRRMIGADKRFRVLDENPSGFVFRLTP